MKNFSISSLANTNYKYFCSIEGSDYIASEFALETILKIITRFKVSSILEVGLGIGSISDTVTKYADQKSKEIEYFGTENNSYCLSVLPNNVKYYNNIRIFNSLDNVDNKQFDLVLIDGLDNSLEKIKNLTKKRSLIYIEGDRKEQTNALKAIFPRSLHVNIITLKKNPPYAHGKRSINNYIGGGQLIFLNPSFFMKLYYLKEKLYTHLIYRIRNIKK